MAHHPCECPACQFKTFNFELLKQRNETKNVLMLEAANVLKVSEDPLVVTLVAKMQFLARTT